MQTQPKDRHNAVKSELAQSLAVSAAAPEDRAQAAALAASLELPLLDADESQDGVLPGAEGHLAILRVEGERLSLQQTGRGAPGPVSVDFGSATMRHRRRGGVNELLGKAVGVGKKDSLSVLDATAGLGRDAFVLADLGCTVQLCERQPVIAQLLKSGLSAAAVAGDAWLAGVVSRMSLWVGDARDLSLNKLGPLDVVYVDPMFADRAKSAAVKKEMAIFQRLLGDTGATGDPEKLLNWALAQNVSRVVVKRALKADPLADIKPSHSIRGKAVRYDVHVLRKL